MYLYYLCNVLGVKLATIKPYITYLQMTQFFSAFISIYYWFPIETVTKRYILCIFLTYTAGLIVLFAQFILNTYTEPKKHKA